MSANLDVVQMTVNRMGDALRFCRMMGMNIPEGQEGESHVETTLPNGLRFAWDAVALMKDFHPDWQPPMGHRVPLSVRPAVEQAIRLLPSLP